jgi:3-hydroxybutyryl-CoA dehydrogenase
MSKPTIAVLGAGRMGSGIAQVFLAAGHPVTLYDVSDEVLASATQRIAGFFSLLEQDKAAMTNLHCCVSLRDAVAPADVIIEAAPEKLEAKIALFEAVDSHAKASALFASNTSAIPISSIAAGVHDRGRFLGMHFWNPPHLIVLVEVVQTIDTTSETITRAMNLLQAVGMEPVHVRKDIPGFVGNRLQHALKREAIALVANGVCDAQTVDQVVTHGFGARLPILGPLEQSDLVGLDLTLNIHEVLIHDLDVTSGPHPLLRAKVAAGETGMKAGRGFYEWTREDARAVQERLDRFLVDAAKRRIRERNPTS